LFLKQYFRQLGARGDGEEEEEAEEEDEEQSLLSAAIARR
jgi:hypothetical protein